MLFSPPPTRLMYRYFFTKEAGMEVEAGQSMSEAQPLQQRKHFFISYTSADRQWAEWIALELEKVGYQTIIQAWDFRPGSNFLAAMDEAAKVADRTIAVLSPKYFESDYTFVEWATAFRSDPKGKQRKLLPIRVEPCD